jgi:hypothetical protein
MDNWKSLGLFIVALVAMLILAVTPAAAEPPNGMHCPSGWTWKSDGGTPPPNGIQVVIVGPEVWFYDANGNLIDVEFCMKAATQSSGKLIGSHGEVGWYNQNSQPFDISHIVIYRVIDMSTCHGIVDCNGVSVHLIHAFPAYRLIAYNPDTGQTLLVKDCPALGPTGGSCSISWSQLLPGATMPEGGEDYVRLKLMWQSGRIWRERPVGPAQLMPEC